MYDIFTNYAFTQPTIDDRHNHLLQNKSIPMLQRILLYALLFLLPVTALSAPGDYEKLISDIEERLDRTMETYGQGKADEAKRLTQTAYFEVFENLEGPIRINISARKSAEMEAAFGEIRRMIVQGQSVEMVKAKTIWLKEQLRAVQPIIETGHVLRAQQTHGAHGNSIDPYWQNRFRQIDDLLADSIALYQKGSFAESQEYIRKAQFEGFKNSEMEIAIRKSRSSKDAQEMNQQFSAIHMLAGNPEQISELGYRITTLLQDLEEMLADLPAPLQATEDTAKSQIKPKTRTRWPDVTKNIDDTITKAIAVYEAGHPDEAIAAVQDAYFDHFEASGMESSVGARDSTAKTALENHFTRLAGLMKAGRPVAELKTTAQDLSQGLAKAAEQLTESGQTAWGLALMSLIIILREGLEALLIVTAIVAYLVKNGHGDKTPLIRNSVVVALIASVVTAALFQWLFANAGAQRELLEGFTMIIATFLLFGMSYWLISKAEAEHWKEYLEGKLSASLTKGSMIGLWFASFVAVYREGAETVLFYQALASDAQDTVGHMAILGGFTFGCLLLAIIYLLMRFSMARLPLKPFFIVTGAFMYLMAFIFAGKSMMELIEGKLFQPVLWSWVPEIPLLGMHPYRETVIPQLVLIVAALIAAWVLLRRPSGGTGRREHLRQT